MQLTLPIGSPRMRRPTLLGALAAGALMAACGAFAAPASGTNHSYPATYVGTAATGGTVEFDVSADGASVTRFAVSNVPTSCGTVSGSSSGSYPIQNNAFSTSQTGVGLRFSGSFPAVQQAQGVLSFRLAFPSCTSADVGWTARTTVPPPDTTAPQTKIKSGPSARTTAQKATFRFRSSEGASSFECKLDRKRWASCRSPKTYKKLKQGKHTFRVRARDNAGNVDATPAKRVWRVEPRS